MSAVLAIASLGASLAGAAYNIYQSRNAPTINTSAADKLYAEADQMNNANTVEKLASEASKASAQQGITAGAQAQAQARTAGMSRAASAQIGANAASNNILNGYGQNWNNVATLAQNKINNKISLGNAKLGTSKENYDSDSKKWSSKVAADSAAFQTAANGLSTLNSLQTPKINKMQTNPSDSQAFNLNTNNMNNDLMKEAINPSSVRSDGNLPINFTLATKQTGTALPSHANANRFKASLPGNVQSAIQ